MHSDTIPETSGPEASGFLLIVEDDLALNTVLCRSMAARGYEVKSASDMVGAADAIKENVPAFAVVDRRLPDGDGLEFITYLKKKAPDCRAVLLTGYGTVRTAVVATNAGAFDVLAKPADADEIHNALRARRHDELLIPFQPATGESVRRKHIDAVYEQFGCNVSETARRLGMHRRTLQRILGKNPPR